MDVTFTEMCGIIYHRDRVSTTETEYVAATEACKEAIWMIRLVGDLGLGNDMPILHSDSQSAIMLAKNPVFHAKTKHIEVKYHFLHQVRQAS